ncbi:hypothetical protein [Flavobacterium sp.]|uniref:hypothetical protein n=1 Tax=Flavobacterium sp. TaxID=239 RepID=UPI00286AAC45|nr:hypothetical protein [Flavobacterium sp.]
MKTIKILLLLVAFSTVTFYSCSDENSIKNETVSQKSIALRTVLNKLKAENAAPNRGAIISATPANPMLCFEFVYPITFSYNNGTAITATSLDGLLDILNNESSTLYLEGVVFPFQVQSGGAVQTITNEADLIALIIQCGLPTFNDDLQHTYCFDIVFPIHVGSGGQLVTIGSQTDLNAYLNNPNSGSEADIIFPISVTYQNQITVIHSVYEFYDMVNNCNSSTCICTQEYAPVCVHTPNGGYLEFGNLCYALCAGYTQNDIVACGPVTECLITDLTAVPGDCNPIGGSYALTINFNAGNTTATHFEVWANDNSVLGVYPIASLPVTIPNYPPSILGIPFAIVKVVINENNEQCSATQQFNIPICNGVCTCPPEDNPVCVQTSAGITHYANPCLAACDGFTPNDFVNCNPVTTHTFGQLLGTCFQIMYPVNVQHLGAIVTAHNDVELLQYWNPLVSSPMPVMIYPITVTFLNTNMTYTFANQQAFQNQINISCP